MGGIYNTVNFHLYHYAGNNPVKYTDPTGAFDIEDFVSSLIELFTPAREKFEKFNIYTSKSISKEEYDTYMQNLAELEPGSVISAYKNKYELLTLTDFGKLSTKDKLDLLYKEEENLIQQFTSNKVNGADIFENLSYGLGEGLFNITSYSNLTEFAFDYLLNNAETIGDLAQFDIDQQNTFQDLHYIQKLIDFYTPKK